MLNLAVIVLMSTVIGLTMTIDGEELSHGPDGGAGSAGETQSIPHATSVVMIGAALLAFSRRSERGFSIRFRRQWAPPSNGGGRATDGAAPGGDHQHRCPDCDGTAIVRVTRHGVLERVVLPVLGRRRYQCLACDRRFSDRPSTARRHGGGIEGGMKESAAPCSALAGGPGTENWPSLSRDVVAPMLSPPRTEGLRRQEALSSSTR